MRTGFLALALIAILTAAACAPQKPSQNTEAPVSESAAAAQTAEPDAKSEQEVPVALQIVGGILAGVLLVAGALVLAIASASDARLKTDITRVGTSESGLPLYTFRYRGDRRVWRGVMAQDVLRHTPGAVVTGRDGYLYVRYKRLGLRMTEVGRIAGPPPEGRRRIRRWRLP